MARAKISTTMQATGICWYQAKLWNISTGQVPSSLKTQAGELAGPVVMSPASAGQNPDNTGAAPARKSRVKAGGEAWFIANSTAGWKAGIC